MVHEQEIECRLRAADRAIRPAGRVVAGPFDPATKDAATTSLSDALVTGLLVVYPAVATVVALVVGLSLSGPVA
ncbi:hypothetical protein ABUE31_17145 [Mesorhizobium sp. ZMM04-5]|uniref:Uncharacterized protein n=2 Tax=Mesorhizobium marinum TaxID=3228790 RepID=A0ABV3R316_9HYPH